MDMNEAIFFRIDTELKQRLKKFAADNNRSVSEEIRHCVQSAMDAKNSAPAQSPTQGN